MQRKHLEKHYSVVIYQTSKGYVVEENGKERIFKYIADVEDYLKEKYKK